VKAPWVLDSGPSYPNFSAFGTKMATLFLENKTGSFLKIYNKEFCWFRVLLG
jgi:hypothetical protein